LGTALATVAFAISGQNAGDIRSEKARMLNTLGTRVVVFGHLAGL
jgi:hypothetical protein